MASLISIKYDVRLVLSGEEIRLTEPVETPTIVVAGGKIDVVMRLAPGGTGNLWTASGSQLGNFLFGFLWTDVESLVELTCNVNGALNMGVQALSAEVPLLLGSDASLYNVSGTDALSSGTPGVIDRIRVTNRSGSQNANYRLLLLN